MNLITKIRKYLYAPLQKYKILGDNIAVYPESLVILNEREGSRAGT